MATRPEPRYRKRIPCKLTRSQSTFSGLVVDLSRRGLFVQTGAVAKTGDDVEIVIRSWNSETTIVLNAQVMWRRKVPLQLRSAVEGGLGLQICYAPEPYYVMLAEASQDSIPNRGRGV